MREATQDVEGGFFLKPFGLREVPTGMIDHEVKVKERRRKYVCEMSTRCGVVVYRCKMSPTSTPTETYRSSSGVVTKNS